MDCMHHWATGVLENSFIHCFLSLFQCLLSNMQNLKIVTARKSTYGWKQNENIFISTTTAVSKERPKAKEEVC